MSLINCPECGNECSATATTCPQCGHPFVKPVAQPRVIVREVAREESFPKWIFIPIALLGLVILFFVFMMLRSDDNAAQRNINTNVATRQPARVDSTTTTTTTVPSTSQPSTITVPSTSQPSTIPAAPPTTTTLPPSTTTTTTTVVEPTPNDKASVTMEAKVLSRTGSAQPVTREKFYLLDKDLESILAEAKIQDDAGQGLINAFGVSVVNPSKYRDTNQKALAAIKRHIVYSTLTDASGKAQLKDVKPKNYYLFGITRAGNGFAVWNSPVNVNAGQNSLILDPVSPTEIVTDTE